MSLLPRTSCAAVCASLLATSALLAGCSGAMTSTPVAAAASQRHWQLAVDVLRDRRRKTRRAFR